ncbi:helix-turn-helix transcriptional regulator [Nocardiopsis dassonvillei]
MDRKFRPEWEPFGASLRRLRKERKLTGEKVAKALRISPTMYSAIERGKRFCVQEHVTKLDELFESGDEVLRLWTKMTSPNKLPDWYYKVPELERAATQIREYQCLLIPGLLQTTDYTRAVFRAARPWGKEADIERMMEARAARWALLEDEQRPLLWFVLSESVLHSPMGSDHCMREQMEHLMNLVKAGKIQLQVLPQRLNAPGKEGPFRIYSFEDKPTLASAEYMTGEEVIDSQQDLRFCEVTYGALQAAALPLSETLGVITKVRENYGC